MAISRIVEGYEEAQVAFAEAGAITTLIQARTTNHLRFFHPSHRFFFENIGSLLQSCKQPSLLWIPSLGFSVCPQALPRDAALRRPAIIALGSLATLNAQNQQARTMNDPIRFKVQD